MVAGGAILQSFIRRGDPFTLLNTIFGRNGTLFIYLHLKHVTPFTYLIRTMRHFSKPLKYS